MAIVRRAVESLVICLLLLIGRGARAESGVYNLHLNLGLIATAPSAVGGVGNVGFDWQLLPPYALDVTIGGGYLSSIPSGVSESRGGGLFDVAVGVRFRFFDNREGYLNDPGGDRWGNLYLVPRLGYLLTAGGGLATSLFTVEAELGYEFSVFRPMQIGLFVKPGVAFGSGVLGTFVTGVAFSFEFVRAPVWDSDGDGVSNERERIRYHTDPFSADTDGGGVPDGDEVARGTDPNNPADDPTHVAPVAAPVVVDNDFDKDGVPNASDACPGTAPGTEVDERGCARLDEKMVFEDITFASGSSEIEPTSEDTLTRAAALLRDNPTVHIEVGGYTDNRGSRRRNRKLSLARAQAVVSWLTAHGVSGDRLSAKGYGPASPKVPNDTPEHRAENRRIELKRLP